MFEIQTVSENQLQHKRTGKQHDILLFNRQLLYKVTRNNCLLRVYLT